MKTLSTTRDLCKLFDCTPATILHYRELGMPYTKLSTRCFVYDEKEVGRWYFHYKTRKMHKVHVARWKGGEVGYYED